MRPPSLDRASLETSTTIGFWGRKLKTNGKADCKLIRRLLLLFNCIVYIQLDAAGGEKFQVGMNNPG